MRLPAVVLLSSVFITAACANRPSATSPVEGAWRIVDDVTTGADTGANHSPQPSLVLFSGPYYSLSSIAGRAPRALWRTEAPTDSERLAAFDAFISNSGRFQITDSTLTIQPIVARVPNYMAGGSQLYRYRRSGDTLWLSARSSDFRWKIGDRVVNQSGPVSEEHFVLIRMP